MSCVDHLSMLPLLHHSQRNNILTSPSSTSGSRQMPSSEYPLLLPQWSHPFHPPLTNELNADLLNIKKVTYPSGELFLSTHDVHNMTSGACQYGWCVYLPDKSSLTCNHIPNCVQGKPQKSNETGPESHGILDSNALSYLAVLPRCHRCPHAQLSSVPVPLLPVTLPQPTLNLPTSYHCAQAQH